MSIGVGMDIGVAAFGLYPSDVTVPLTENPTANSY